MQIANPIYDVVFKYLMDDSKIAKLLLSTIIEEEITELSILPQENIANISKPSERREPGQIVFTVYKLDFSATIKTDTGYKHVLIEIQKAKYASDLMRFRRYLGEQYQKTHSVKIDDQIQEKTLPILSIYFLGHKLDHITAPLIKVKRHYYDLTNKQEIKEKEEFIESLTHDSFIIQIPALRTKYKTEAEQILSVFDQKHIEGDHHLLNIQEENYSEKYRPLIRRLQRAVAEPQVRKTMDIEDEILEELGSLERKLAKKDEVIAEKDQALVEKDQALVEKNQALVEKNQALVEKDQLIEQLRKKLGLI